ncbi:MAG: aspartate/glutamate racemase family protein [Pseudomonadota bacterium]
MHIGLIGGIGPAATDFYYQGLIKRAAAKGVDMDLTMVHADSPTLLANLQADDKATQSEIYMRLTERLAQAGAACVVITSVSGHFPIDVFQPKSPLPVIDIMATLRAHLADSGLKRVGIMGTRPAMASAMFGKLGALDVIAPAGDALNRVHDAYVELAVSGQPTNALRSVFFEEGATLVRDAGAEAVLLGGTDLNVAFEGHDPGFALVDCADIHVDEVAKRLSL